MSFDSSPAGQSAAVRGARPGAACGVGPDAATPLVERLPGATGGAAAVASSAGCPPLDIPAATFGTPTHWPRGAGADRAARAREPGLGYLRIVGELRKL